MKASDISDDMLLKVVAQNHKQGLLGATTRDIQKDFNGYPPKVVLAKLKSLLRRKLISGCVCGCRGDFAIVVEKEHW